jgi:hypothetical protein
VSGRAIDAFQLGLCALVEIGLRIGHARLGVWDRIMDTLAAGHDAAVQMIDTSVVRVYQHGASVADNNTKTWAARGAA